MLISEGQESPTKEYFSRARNTGTEGCLLSACIKRLDAKKGIGGGRRVASSTWTLTTIIVCLQVRVGSKWMGSYLFWGRGLS